MKYEYLTQPAADSGELHHIILEFMEMLGTSAHLPDHQNDSSSALLVNFNSLISEWYNR